MALGVAAVLVLLLLTSLHAIAVGYTNLLWFQAQSLTSVWDGVLSAKLELAAAFVALFFVLAWVNLAIVDLLSRRYSALAADDEVAKRYRGVVAPHRRLLRTVISLLLALLVGGGASSQWKHWLMMRHAVAFGSKDPVFHRDVSFYVFRLPFLQYLVGWGLAAFVVLAILVAGMSYLSGGIRPHAPGTRVVAEVKAHLSVLMAVLALLKAAGYELQKMSLVTATDGFAEGAFYTDIHARMPALTLLVIISLFAFLILLGNIRRRGWALPGIAVGLWALVSVAVGGIYPAVVQRFLVDPSQQAKELPYIARNIAATRAALGLSGVQSQAFPASQNITAPQLDKQKVGLEGTRLWDPSIALTTVRRLQDIRSYYTFPTLSVNRAKIGGHPVPVIVGVRQLNPSQVPNPSWVNVHLQYTHGYGVVEAPANQVNGQGNPPFVLRDVPLRSSSGAPKVTQPAVYYGLGQSGYVIANSRQPELQYSGAGGPVESHYSGTGGVRLSSLERRLAFALRFGDLNVLISGQITPHSRLMMVRDVRARVAKAAPFLTLGSGAYPVIVGGHIDWVVDAYTSSSRYPYAQAAQTGALPSSSPLAGKSFNYIRNSVKVVVNAYTGHMTFYAWDSSDPLLKAWEQAFPRLFTPASAMPGALRSQLRYPTDLFTVQAQAYGYYHITNPASFYSAGDAWSLSASPGSGAPGGSAGASSPAPPMQPEYAEVQLPGTSAPRFVLMEPYVPVSTGATGSGSQQDLTGFLVAGSGPGNYGRLTVYVTPRGKQVDGPALVNSRINADTAVSSQISFLDQHGSQVTEGSVMLVPVGKSLLYVRPLYIESHQNPLPEIKEVIVVYGNSVTMATTLPVALDEAFGSNLSGRSGATSLPASSGIGAPGVASLVGQANTALSQAQADLKAGNLGGYQSEVQQAQRLLGQAMKLQARYASHTQAGKGSL